MSQGTVSNQHRHGDIGIRLTRRRALTAGLALAAGSAVTARSARLAAATARSSMVALPSQRTRALSAQVDQAEAIVALTRDFMNRYDLKAVILRVTIAEEEVVTEALGESMAGVPATPDMHFRNGAVAISYLSTLLLQFVDQGVVGLDDPLSNWLPDLPEADRVTLRMLANMTAGYADHVRDEAFVDAVNTDPFRQWSPQELIEISTGKPHVFAPGTNWDYSHTGYVILGQALEKIGGKPMATLMQENILGPLGLDNTTGSDTPTIPEPVLHAFTSERRATLGVEPGVRFYEESTFWNPSWSIAQGAIQTTNIYDMATSAEAIGTGALLTPASHQLQISPDLIGFGAPLEGCFSCHTLEESWNYGLGIVRMGPWLVQSPLLAGWGSVMAYLPPERIAVAIVSTFGEQSFDEQGNNLYEYASQEIFAAIADLLAPAATPTASS